MVNLGTSHNCGNAFLGKDRERTGNVQGSRTVPAILLLPLMANPDEIRVYFYTNGIACARERGLWGIPGVKQKIPGCTGWHAWHMHISTTAWCQTIASGVSCKSLEVESPAGCKQRCAACYLSATPSCREAHAGRAAAAAAAEISFNLIGDVLSGGHRLLYSVVLTDKVCEVVMLHYVLLHRHMVLQLSALVCHQHTGTCCSTALLGHMWSSSCILCNHA